MAANQDTSPNLIMELTHAVERTEVGVAIERE